MPPYSLLPQKQRGLEWDRGRFLKTGYLSDKVYTELHLPKRSKDLQPALLLREAY